MILKIKIYDIPKIKMCKFGLRSRHKIVLGGEKAGSSSSPRSFQGDRTGTQKIAQRGQSRAGAWGHREPDESVSKGRVSGLTDTSKASETH